MKAVDLFCGCGGLSLGAHMAGFRSVLAVDIDETLSSSFSTNFPQTKLENLNLLDADLRPKVQDLCKTRLSAVLGGPPCQGFSSIGGRNPADPRNQLIKAYFRHVSELRPKFFVMENVPGILQGQSRPILDDAISSLEGPYTVLEPILLDAADFGAATHRPRMVLVGYDPSCMDRIDHDVLIASKKTAATVRDAIGDLPNTRKNAASDLRKLEPSRKVSSYVKRLTLAPPEDLANEEVRSRHAEHLVTGFSPTLHSADVEVRFRKTREGGKEPISRYTRLSWSKPAPVLRSGTGSERGSFQAARPIHPAHARVITVREAARIQGFPDWFTFHTTKWHSHRMIGNSVSPVFAEALLSALFNACESDARDAA